MNANARVSLVFRYEDGSEGWHDLGELDMSEDFVAEERHLAMKGRASTVDPAAERAREELRLIREDLMCAGVDSRHTEDWSCRYFHVSESDHCTNCRARGRTMSVGNGAATCVEYVAWDVLERVRRALEVGE